jgi:tetratricopeptide (TPR) repeat protein
VALNLIEALAALDKPALAAEGARRLLARLARPEGPRPADLEGGHFPPAFDHFRVEWECCAWQNAGRPGAEARAKCELLRWRLHSLLGELTGDLHHLHEAVLARPDLPPGRAALGLALERAGRADEALPHLLQAVAGAPLDAAAARALHRALLRAGDPEAAARLAHERLLLARAAPEAVAPEPWFLEGAATAAPTRPKVSLCMIVRDEEDNLPACLATVADLVDEIIVVDTGSADRTREIAASFGARVHDFPWCDSFAAARNEGLRHATGQWVLWLDADDRLDGEGRQRLARLLAGLGDEAAAYVMKCRCLAGPDRDADTVVDHLRLFRNDPALRWDYRVHEQVLPAVRRLGHEVRWSDVVIVHTGYQDGALRRRKLERDLRLLRLEDADRPDEPFTLFNLGAAHLELGQPREALPLLQRSLDRSHPSDSIVRKLYALMAQCHRQLGAPAAALAVCRAGQSHYPHDAELLFLEGALLEQLGRDADAEARWLGLLAGRDGPHFGSVVDGLRGPRARERLAALYARQGRHAEAEAQCRAAAALRPDGGAPPSHGEAGRAHSG